MRAGTKALGLSVKWRYHFVGPGSVVAPTHDAVYLDVGGALCRGVIDQHQDGTLGRSTAELVLRHPELVYGHLMDGWLKRRDAGQDLRNVAFSPVLVTHTDPDFDAMVACWLVQRLIEDGDLPPESEALAGYSALVDQGEYKVDPKRPATATEAIHVAYLGLQNLPGDPNPAVRHSHTLARGFKLLDTAMPAITKARGHLHGLGVGDLFPPSARPEAVARAATILAASEEATLPAELRSFERDARVAIGVVAWRAEEAGFTDVVAMLDTDRARFRHDLENATKTEVELPANDGGPAIKVMAFIAQSPTESKLNKYWVRAAGFRYFVCPYKPNAEGHFQQVILSLDPTWRDDSGRRPTLKGLGFRLEQAEANARRATPGLDRGLPERWADGTCDNADPWYDGRGHDHGIVDTPRCGTVLPYAEVCKVARSAFWEVRLDAAEVYIAIPDENAPLSAATGLPLPTQATEALAAWYADSGQRVARSPAPLGDQPLPRGLAVVEDGHRTFPHGTSPAFRVVKIGLPAGAHASLDQLVEWLSALNRSHRGRLYTVAHVRFERGVVALAEPGRLLSRLCAATGTLREEDRDVVLYNGRAIALSERGAGAADGRTGLLLELLLYAAFQAEALQGFTKRILGVLATGPRLIRGEEVRRDFLMFHAKYVHNDVVFDGDAREVYTGLREALGLAEQHAKTTADLDRLAELEQKQLDDARQQREDEAERKTNLLLFFVGLTGIVQAGTVAFSEVAPWQNASVGGALLAAATYYYYVNYWRKDGES